MQGIRIRPEKEKNRKRKEERGEGKGKPSCEIVRRSANSQAKEKFWEEEGDKVLKAATNLTRDRGRRKRGDRRKEEGKKKARGGQAESGPRDLLVPD